MRISRLVSTAVVATAAALSLIGCDAPSVNTTVPPNIEEIQASEPGKSLKEYGYTPVVQLFAHDDATKIVGQVYIACGDTNDWTECSNDIHNRGTLERPNVYVEHGKIVTLEGPHTSDTDNRSYYVAVPETKTADDPNTTEDESKNYQDFAALSAEDQKKLLGVMPTIQKEMGSPSSFNGDPTEAVIQTDIGQVVAWVSR